MAAVDYAQNAPVQGPVILAIAMMLAWKLLENTALNVITAGLKPPGISGYKVIRKIRLCGRCRGRDVPELEVPMVYASRLHGARCATCSTGADMGRRSTPGTGRTTPSAPGAGRSTRRCTRSGSSGRLRPPWDSPEFSHGVLALECHLCIGTMEDFGMLLTTEVGGFIMGECQWWDRQPCYI